MLASRESNSTVTLKVPSDLDLHFTPSVINLSDNSDNFAVIKINDIVWFEIPLNLIIINSDVLRIRSHLEFTPEHVDAGATSDPHGWSFVR